jgi:hypothetical protein
MIEVIHWVDSESRRQQNTTWRMQDELLLAMLREGASPRTVGRQIRNMDETRARSAHQPEERTPMLDLDGLEREAFERGREEGLAERVLLQRRIKNQRKALRELNKTMKLYSHMIREHVLEKNVQRSNAYRHAAQMAETFHYWPFGKRIGAYIRKWI